MSEHSTLTRRSEVLFWTKKLLASNGTCFLETRQTILFSRLVCKLLNTCAHEILTGNRMSHHSHRIIEIPRA